MNLKIKKLSDNAVIPTYGSEYAAGADLYSCEGELTFEPGETKLVHTGLAMEIPVGYVGLIYARSGIATKRGLAPANKVGVIDSDYRGEIMVALHNHSNESQTIAASERIAQIKANEHLLYAKAFIKVPKPRWGFSWDKYPTVAYKGGNIVE
jgi:dUTP pyrophosphatase